MDLGKAGSNAASFLSWNQIITSIQMGLKPARHFNGYASCFQGNKKAIKGLTGEI